MFLFQNWIIFAALAGLGSNIFNFLNRYILKGKDDPTIYAWQQEFYKFLIFGLIAFWDWKIILNSYSIIIFLFLGITEWLGIYFFMKMHYFSHLSISAIISRTRLVWVAIIAYILLGEKLKTPEYVGILILFMGLSIVVAPKKLFVDRGAIYANLASIMIALNTVLIKMAVPYASNSVINGIMVLPALLLFPIFIKGFRKKLKSAIKINFSLKLVTTIISVLSLYLLTASLRLGESGKVLAIYQGMLIFSVLAGIIFLRERKNIGRKLIGTAITLVGVLFLTSN